MASHSLNSSRHQGVCNWWIAYTFDNPLRRFIHNPSRMLGSYVKEGMTALDLGCGMGYFSIGMARLVGPTGRVIAVDLQQKMLDVMQKRVRRAGLAERIVLHRCPADDIGINVSVDFILAFWMVHEVPDQNRFFRQLISLLRAGGKVLIVEPKMHVSVEALEETLDIAQSCGLQCIDRPAIRLSRSALLAPAPD